MGTLLNKTKNANSPSKSTNDEFYTLLLNELYGDYRNRMSVDELDEEFRDDMYRIGKALKNLPRKDRKIIVAFLSRYIENYIELKLDKEIGSYIERLM